MLCKILKYFPYSEDGFTAKGAEVGEERNIPDELVPGLVAEGYVSAAEAETEPPSEDVETVETEAETEPSSEGNNSEDKGKEDDIDALRERAETLGIDVDSRWGATRLEQEIAKVD